MKRAFMLLLVTIIVLSLASCGKSESSAPAEERNGTYYSAEAIGVKSANGVQGFFVLNEDGTFSPLVSAFTGYKKETDEPSPSRFLWGVVSTENPVMSSIPEVKKGDQIVMMYNTSDNIPEEYTIEKYSFKGYTIGAHFYSTADQKLFLETGKYLPGSDMEQYIKFINDEEEYAVDAINESNNLPLKNIDNNIEMLLGLEEGKYYQIDFFKGTKYMGFTAKADTFVFQSESVITLQNPYTKTQNGYFILNLPDNLEEGYYYICGSGMCHIN